MIGPPLQDHSKKNFETLKRAMRNGDLALVSMFRHNDVEPRAVCCAIQENENGTFTPIPLAEMIEGNPFEIYEDPTEK